MISLILIIITGLSNGIMDMISFHFDESIFKKYPEFCNPAISWRNKYKSDLQTERFPFSTSFLVCFTDLWHLCKEIMISSLCLAAAVNLDNVFFCYLAFRGIYAVAFYVTYK